MSGRRVRSRLPRAYDLLAARREVYNWVKEYFTAPWASEFFDCDVLMGLLDEHYEGKAQNQRKIYTPLVFLIWYKRYFIDE